MAKKKDEIIIRSSAAEYLTYVASVGDQQDSIEMRYEDENIWLTQKMMATLYDVDVRTINEHIKKIYSDSRQESCADPKVLLEQRVDFSRWVEQGFGTADCIIIADSTLRIYITSTVWSSPMRRPLILK